MKHAFLIGDGMADRPVRELGGRTPLQAARTPFMDRISAGGRLGLINNYSGKKFGMNSDVCIMSLLGYDPKVFYSGRGPLEALSMNIPLEDDQIAFRCNLATVSRNCLVDYSAGHISSREAAILIEALNAHFKKRGICFHPGVSYRHIAVVTPGEGVFSGEGVDKAVCLPPHDVVDFPLDRILPSGKGRAPLVEIMLESRKVLEENDVNYVRRQLDENPANIAWLWGQGKTPAFTPFQVRGAAISAVDVVKGIALAAGMEVVNVPGATGYFDTDYAAKGRRAVELLEDYDFVLVHVEAPDEAGHMGKLAEKITAIENFDLKVVGPVFLYIESKGGRIAVLPDHATPVSEKKHTSDRIPFAIAGDGIHESSGLAYSEENAKKTGVYVPRGYEFMREFLG